MHVRKPNAKRSTRLVLSCGRRVEFNPAGIRIAEKSHASVTVGDLTGSGKLLFLPLRKMFAVCYFCYSGLYRVDMTHLPTSVQMAGIFFYMHLAKGSGLAHSKTLTFVLVKPIRC